MWPFKKKTIMEELIDQFKTVEPDEFHKLLFAMKILEKEGICIKTVEFSSKLIKKIKKETKFVIPLGFGESSYPILQMFVDKKKFSKKQLKFKPKEFIGMVFGINIVCGKNG